MRDLAAPLQRPMPQTFVFSTYGARGDVFPYLAIARELRARGQRAILATSANYRAEIEALGLEFRAVAPDAPTPRQARQMMHPRNGTEFLFRDLLLPSLRQSVSELRAATQNADVLVTHTTSLAGPIVAQLEAARGLRWVSSAASPLALLTPDVALPALPRAADYPAFNRAMLGVLKRQLGMKLKATQQFRAELGLSRGDNALWSDAHSPQLQLALWPDFFAPVPPDSTRKAVGFCFLPAPEPLSPATKNWLNAGAPPLLFVAASFAQIERWEREALQSARALGRRAILLGAVEDAVSPAVLRCRFAPLDALLPHCAALIHAGGIGTLALGLRAAIPMLLLPRAHDQFDNARRAEKLGLARVARRGDLAAQIRAVLGDETLKERLELVGGEVENGAVKAADILAA